MAPIVTYLPAEDGSGRMVMRTVYDDGTVFTQTLPVVKRGPMPGAAGGKRPTHSRGIDTGSLTRSER